MATNYVAKYGDTIRRLAALDLAAKGDPNLAGAGPQPQTSPFDMGAQQSYPPALGAAGEGPQDPAIDSPAPGPHGPGVTPQKLWEGMSAAERKQVVKQVEDKGVNIDKKYDEMVASGQIVPPEKVLKKGEKLTVMAETLLRFAQNIGGGMEGGAAGATAILDTQGRRGGLEREAAMQEAAMKEKLRLEGREDTKTAQTRAEKIADTESEHTYKDRDREDTQAHELEKQRAEAAAAKLREKGKNVRTFTAADGSVVNIDTDTNKVVPLEVETEETTTTRGQRGRPGTTTTKKVRKPLKGIPTNAAGGTATLDPDTVLRSVMTEVTRISGDRKAMKEITARAEAEGRDVQDVLLETAKKNVGGVTPENAGSSGDDPYNLLGG